MNFLKKIAPSADLTGIKKETHMAKILENTNGRRLIQVSTDDIIALVREYQTARCSSNSYEETRKLLDKKYIYIPEDFD